MPQVLVKVLVDTAEECAGESRVVGGAVGMVVVVGSEVECRIKRWQESETSHAPTELIGRRQAAGAGGDMVRRTIPSPRYSKH
jgi:hypothetical protein